MVEIRINGSNPPSKPANNGTFTVSDNANRQSSFDMARKQQSRQQQSSDADYDRATRQQAQQQRAENSAYQRHESLMARERAKQERLMARETAQYESQLRQDSRIANARQKEARALEHRFGNLTDRGAAPLTPSSWHVLQRSIGTFQHQSNEYQIKHGVQSPVSASQVRGLRESLGSEPTAYRVGETLRLGNIGQRQAFQGEYVGLHRIERELRKIDRDIEHQSKFQQSPAAQANLERQKDALLTARNRIQAGWQGTSRVRRSVGMAFGAVGDLAENPVLLAAGATAAAAASAPYDMAALYQRWVGLQRRGLDFTINSNAVGRAGGWNGQDLRRALLRPINLKNAYSTLPSDWLSDETARWGIGPEDAVRRLQKFGIGTPSARYGLDTVERIKLLSLQPGNSLGEDQISSILGRATSAGMTPNTAQGQQKFLDKLLKVQEVATRQGIDASTFSQSWTHFVSANVSRGLTGSTMDALTKFYDRLAASGAPGARSGALQSSIAAGTSQFIGGLGVGPNMDVPADIATMSAFHGKLPTTEAELKKDFPGLVIAGSSAKYALKQYLDAAKSGSPFSLNLLQPLLQGQSPDTIKAFLSKSPILRSMSPAMRSVVTAQLLGTDITSYTGWQSAPSSAPTLGLPQLPNRKLTDTILKYAQKYNLQPSQAFALFDKESGFRNVVSDGAYGYGQVRQLALTDYNKRFGTSWTLPDLVKNPDLGIKVSEWYLHHRGSYENYHGLSGIGATPQQIAADDKAYARLQEQYKSMDSTLSAQSKLGAAQGAGIAGSQMISKVSDTVVASFKSVSNAADGVVHSLDSLKKRLDAEHHSPLAPHAANPRTHRVFPGGTSIAPADRSHRVVK